MTKEPKKSSLFLNEKERTPMAGRRPNPDRILAEVEELRKRVEAEVRNSARMRAEAAEFAKKSMELLGAIEKFRSGEGIPYALIEGVEKALLGEVEATAENAAKAAVLELAELRILRIERELREMRKTLLITVGAGFSIAVILSALLEKLI